MTAQPSQTGRSSDRHQYVFDFTEGNKDQKDLLGGKGANLAEMTNLGLPVPPGFTISTEACRAYLADGTEPEGLAEEVGQHLAAMEEEMPRCPCRG
jgi:pyruvate, orthophosphate dikinase